MQQRQLNQFTTSALGLGCMGMSEFYGETDATTATEVIHYAVEHGITLFDTADVYGFGHNEQLLGQALKTLRQQVHIATKFGILRDQHNPHYRELEGRPEYVKRSCDLSLQRLGTDYIDLYYLHRIDPTVPIEDTIGAMSDLVSKGKVRYIGISEASSETIRRANAIHPLTAVQSEYSLCSRDIENNQVLSTCQTLEIGLVAYSPLSRALLTNHFTTDFSENDFRQFLPRFQQDNLKHNQVLIEQLKTMAQDKHCSLAQLSLAWVLAQSDNIVPIPGTKRLSYLKDNIEALDVELFPNELQEIRQLISHFMIKGERYPQDIITTHNLNG